MAYKFIIDAGHGGFDSGAVYKDRTEKNDNLNLAMAVGDMLKQKGYEVDYTRTGDDYENPDERAKDANEKDADFLISLHRNTSPYPNTYRGVEAFIFNDRDIKENMANNIGKGLENVGFNNMGINVRRDIAILKKTKMPAILLQVGFINSDKDNELFDENFSDVVDAIVNGIDQTLREEQYDKVFKYRVQAGLFRHYNNALNLQSQLIQAGFDAEIGRSEEYYVVYVGNFDALADAQEVEKQMNRAGFTTIITTT